MSESKYKYNQDDRVYFDMGNNIKGWAKVKGCSTEPQEGLGRGWLVEVEEPCPFDRKIYPFSTILIFDIMIKDPPVSPLTEEAKI